MALNAGMVEEYGFFKKEKHVPRKLETLLNVNYGIDFKNKRFVNMFDAGIIDPFKVVRIALESAVSIAISLITTETVIVEETDDKTAR